MRIGHGNQVPFEEASKLDKAGRMNVYAKKIHDLVVNAKSAVMQQSPVVEAAPPTPTPVTVSPTPAPISTSTSTPTDSAKKVIKLILNGIVGINAALLFFDVYSSHSIPFLITAFFPSTANERLEL